MCHSLCDLTIVRWPENCLRVQWNPLSLPAKARWVEKLMPFPLTFEYVPQASNGVSDALSRYPSPSACSVTVVTPQLVGLLQRVQIAAQEDQAYRQALLEAHPATWVGVQQAARVSSGLQPMGLHRGARANTSADYLNMEGVLFTPSGQVIVPNNEQLRTLALAEAHDGHLNGYFGEAKTLEKVRRRWFWDGMTRDVKEYIASCLLCQ